MLKIVQTRAMPRMSRLRGRTLGLIGFGAIARAVVPRAAGFGLNVIACDPYVDADPMALAGVRAVSLVQRPWQETLRLLDGEWPAGWIDPQARAAY